MKRLHTVVLAALAAGLAAGPAFAGSSPSSIDPGFNPQSGQINPGHAPEPWSATRVLPQDNRPPQEQARAALMMPDPVGVSSLGAGAQPPAGQSTTGTGAPAAPQAVSTSPGPIGATLQTMPAKFSQRNDMLDHLPIMSWPLRLTAQQRQQIYRAVMADKSPPAPGAEKLKPASSLSYAQARDLRPLPQQLSGIDALHGLQYVKAKDKALLVRPAVQTVVDQITM